MLLTARSFTLIYFVDICIFALGGPAWGKTEYSRLPKAGRRWVVALAYALLLASLAPPNLYNRTQAQQFQPSPPVVTGFRSLREPFLTRLWPVRLLAHFVKVLRQLLCRIELCALGE